MFKSKPLLLLAGALILLNLGLGSWGLTESSEARYAEISTVQRKLDQYQEAFGTTEIRPRAKGR